jgi:membrane protease YdiL (CAAX protease family)
MLAFKLPGPPDLGPVPDATWRIADIFPAFLASEGLAALLATVGRRWFAVSYDDIYAFGAILTELALFACVYFWLKVLRPAPFSVFGRSHRVAKDIGLGILVGFGMLFLSASIVATLTAIWSGIFGREPFTGGTLQLGSNWALLATGIGMIIAAPLAEELFFRGFSYGALRNRFAAKHAAPMSAALFAVAHIYPVKMMAMFVAGLLLANLYETRRNLLPSIAAHMTNNLVAFLVALGAAHRL